MKKIALDTSALKLRRSGKTYQTGIYRYALELTKRLSQCQGYQIHFTDQNEPICEHFDLYHSLFHAFPPPKTIHDHPKTETLITFHDLIAWLYPELFPLGSKEISKVRNYLKGNWFLSPSNSTKKDLIEHFEIEAHRIFVTPLAACPLVFYPNPSDTVLDKYGIRKEPYFLFVGRLEERKGIHLLLETFYQLIEQEQITDLNLVLCGPLTSTYSQIFHALSNGHPTSKPKVFHIPYAKNEDLSALYSGALGFVFLSRYEGFGLPLLEAMQCGTPPICFNHSSHPEVVGSGGILAPDQDLDFVAQKMLELYQNPLKAKQLSEQALHRSNAFSWEITVEKTLKAYQKILFLS